MGEGTGQLAANNFLIPNGTFFVELIIFLVVLGVIWVFVVPPIRRVLEEREGVVAKTTEDTREATATFAAAETRYREALAEARGEAGRIRDEARAEGQVILDEMRTQAKQQADGIASQAATELRAQGDQIAAELRAGVGPVSQALADRVLGVGETVSGSQAGRG
ncbi:MAG: F0F1 ATP synthase subunit B [Mycobacteriaceae bacterium]|nr:F0F1 ATP synthase subunit B [Mycobacteriaceae bacterium]